jgi:UDP-N-acetylglucosamine transferase subunit ALG13
VIYVTVGTMFLDFPRLITAMDAIAASTGERVVVQRGMGRAAAPHCQVFDFKSHDDIMALNREARVIVTHAGIGCIRDAMNARRPLIVVPRLFAHGEHMSDHQLDIARAVERRGWGRVVLDVSELVDACASPPPIIANYTPDRARLIASIREKVNIVAEIKARRAR